MINASCLLFTASAICSAAAGVPEIGLGFVTVGDPGNLAYQDDRYHTLALTGRGSVDYRYAITRSEMNTADYLEFYSTFSTVSDALEREIRPQYFAGTKADPTYNGPGEIRTLNPNRFQAERVPIIASRRQGLMYANWLHSGKSSNIEDLYRGAYDFDAAGNAPVTHEPDARYRLPTVDEYLKAAHYDPDKNGNGPGWWQYAHASDAPPIPGVPSEGGEMPWGVPPGVLQDLFGTPGPAGIPLGSYPDVRSHYGLIDLITGSGEFLSEVELIYFEDAVNDFLGPEAWYFANRDTPLWNQAIGAAPGSFRIVVVPAPSVAAAVWGGAVLVAGKRKRESRVEIP
jgi:hypothetical protein